MTFKVDGNDIFPKDRQLAKQLFFKEVMPSGNVMEVKPVHSEYLLLVDYQCYTLKTVEK